jgi:hypothetical protein
MAQGNDHSIPADGLSSYLLTIRPAMALKSISPFAVNIKIECAMSPYGKNNYTAHIITIKVPVYISFAKPKGE